MFEIYKLGNMIIKNNKKKNEKKNEKFSENTTSSTITENVDPTIIFIIIALIIVFIMIAYRLSYNGKDYDRHFGWGFANFLMLIFFPGEFIFYHIGVTSGLKWVLNGNNVVPEGWYKGSIEEAINNFENKGSPLLNPLQQYSEA